MRERRRGPRYPAQDVRGTLLLTTSATIMNMSLTGMAVESPANLRIGRSYTLALTHGRDQGPALTGVVVWCHLKAARPSVSGEGAAIYEAGIQYTGMLSEKANELMSFLRTTAILTMQDRLTGRFYVDPNESIHLAAECEFAVKTLSASGMLIEADVSPAPGAFFEVRVVLGTDLIQPTVRVVSVRDVGEHDKRRISAIGVEFVSISAADRSALDDFIADRIPPGG